MNTSDTPTPDTISLTEVLNGRANTYRLFSRMYLKPLSEDEIEELAASDFIAAAASLDDTSLLAEGLNDMGRNLKKRHTGTRQLLSTDFTMCFDGVATFEEQVAVPYASVFLAEKALLNQEPRHKVYHLYREENISLKSGINLPEDHLSFELEFLAILSDRTATAYESGDKSEALRNLQLSQEFIKEHILTWLDLLTERANKLLTTRFYRGVLKATKGYLELDITTIEDLIAEL